MVNSGLRAHRRALTSLLNPRRSRQADNPGKELGATPMPTIDLAAMARALKRETAGRLRQRQAKKAGADNSARKMALLRARALNARSLTIEDFREYAAQHGIEARTLHVVVNAFSIGGGFNEAGRVQVMVEPDVFSALTGHAFDRSHPQVSYPKRIPWSIHDKPPPHFKVHPFEMDQDQKWALFAMMADLDPSAALGAMKVGRFLQPIGSPHAGVGWKLLRMASEEALFDKLRRTERDQLEVFLLNFVAHGAIHHLRERNWRMIARTYDGPGQVVRYAELLELAYHKAARLYP
jgi:hypothetical protein